MAPASPRTEALMRCTPISVEMRLTVTSPFSSVSPASGCTLPTYHGSVMASKSTSAPSTGRPASSVTLKVAVCTIPMRFSALFSETSAMSAGISGSTVGMMPQERMIMAAPWIRVMVAAGASLPSAVPQITPKSTAKAISFFSELDTEAPSGKTAKMEAASASLYMVAGS
ncbi:MAG: hypothetical protein BWY79_01516 [Actinobacteria bacterium ADurb.Bin444]|nr:MAG: hypothetical protein BWY79_01516 [Actinobacteria bacterium ADurb.Bin444]